MTFKHKLSRRLALLRGVLLLGALGAAAGCDLQQLVGLLKAVVVTVVVEPAAPTFTVGATVQLTATPKDASGNALSGRVVTWATNNAGAATVNGSGLVTGVGAGSATISAASEGMSGTAAVTVTALPPPPPPPSAPGTVTNLAVAGVTATSVTLSFTEVTDGIGQPASYEVRFARAPISWGSATAVAQGTCAVPLAGTAIGATRSCTVLGLTSVTAYQFQLVAFRGTLNVNAVFGGLSNVASGTTAASTAPVASVTVSPGSASLVVGATQQFTATLKDANGNTLTGRSVTWTSSSPAVATVTGSGLATGVTVGTATATATSEGQSGAAAITVSVAPPGGTWPNEPAGFVAYNDQPWDLLTGNGWSYLRRASAKDASIVTDATAPLSPSKVLQMVYTAGCCLDADPSVHWIGLPMVREVYTAWWMKLSPNWIPNPAGGGKITFLWTDGPGNVYTNLYHPCAFPEGCSPAVQGPPYKVGANTQWAPYGQKVWYPNVTTTWINPGEWHRIEFYYRWGTAGNGIIRWWVDGVLNGDYTTVSYPSGLGFQQFEFAPVVQYAGPAERYMYIDHTHVSIP